MTEIILTFALISFGVFFFGMLMNLRRFEIENRNLRKEISELKWNQIKI
jgi:hypothetical protein